MGVIGAFSGKQTVAVTVEDGSSRDQHASEGICSDDYGGLPHYPESNRKIG